MIRHLLTVAVVFSLFACGGAPKEAEEPDDSLAEEEPEESAELIPAEKFDEINKTFERKRSQVSRCFVVGLDAGEVQKTEKGIVTVGVTILPSGDPSNVKVVETSFKSAALERCVVDYAKTWQFTTLPKSLDYTFIYKLERF